jgi:hypothetical protein
MDLSFIVPLQHVKRAKNIEAPGSIFDPARISPKIEGKTMRKFIGMLAVAAALVFVGRTQAQVIVYDCTTSGALAGYGEPIANNPILGDSLNLTLGGTMQSLKFVLYNSNAGGNTGAILTGNMLINIYDNTVPYASGSLSGGHALLFSNSFGINFGVGGLPAGSFSTISTGDLTAFNVTLPTNIVMTEQFTQVTGTSNRIGDVIFNNPTVGTSPNTVYIFSGATPEGLYTFGGSAAPGQFGFQVSVAVPEPSSVILASVAGIGGLLRWRKRRSATLVA